MLGRPYSFVNAPGTAPHEFYFVTVPDGPLSTRLAALAPGDPIWLLRSANGFFSVGELPDADALWCLATGTGLGPFLSILRTPEPWAKFGRIVLVHAVRRGNELTYRDVIAGIAADHPGAFTYIPMVSREAAPRRAGGAHSRCDPRRPPRIPRRTRAGRGELARDALRQPGDGRRHAEGARGARHAAAPAAGAGARHRRDLLVSGRRAARRRSGAHRAALDRGRAGRRTDRLRAPGRISP